MNAKRNTRRNPVHHALVAEWKQHKPIPGDYPERQRDPEWSREDARAYDMGVIADGVLKLLKYARPERNLGIAYVKPNGETIERFTEWQRERNHIHTGGEYFLVWDYSPDWETDKPDLLYAIDVSADSALTAAAELMCLVSRKF